ncbi:TlyA family rRNA (cytidine-2'-O)-methyltransferase, partial [Streptococcus danieliae]|nr:TlyA family rRNA (cytidine-2'-O)-methyltransferase [Streptococcus danieliae]
DDRVCVMEKTNFRYCTKDQFSKPIDRVSIDVSFISLTLILPTLSEIIADNGQVCALIKPQFEAGRDKVGKGGIVRDKNIHLETIEKIYFFANSLGFSVKKLTFSPITGGEGNIEYLIILEYTKEISNNKDIEIVKVVDLAHSKFK